MKDKVLRRKSPRAPSIALDEAIERVLRVYEKERRHAAPTDVVAQDIGYKSANNGAALSVLASLRYFGLLERPEDGKLAVTKDVESYNFSPSDNLRREILLRWLKSPQIFSDLLEKYQGGLPSDANLRYDLIQRGFSPPSAEETIGVFKRSVEFAGYFERPLNPDPERPEFSGEARSEAPAKVLTEQSAAGEAVHFAQAVGGADQDSSLDRIPVRLPGGRRAWLTIPSPFYEADKARLKAQIDLLLTNDGEAAE
ncbi:MAG TPA: hypothetical protein VGK37_13510 [Casimicrobiaceae bacterium]|jgi:hypothetical protein